ncbi:hypothetical protein KP509_03G018400 [Ceratopteris richardii]|uniref:Stigma-specific STIG1-like protein 1 n=1 Tax=Ceratopteris richardii TaxID=49495 RepID=A0A8T2V9G6_CERRI|nr:hypothetical protein KP509_03G018400 [Ceratopteris richardii]
MAAGRSSLARHQFTYRALFYICIFLLLLCLTQDAMAQRNRRFRCRKRTCVSLLGKSARCCGRFVCRDLASDPNNCGGCGRACRFGRSCCRGKCVNLNTNRKHCGSCGAKCPKRQKCSFGICNYGR